MYPIYKFELTIGATTKRCYPIYRDDLAKVFELQQGEEFFRAKLSGKLTFESYDYSRIVAAAFDTQFLLDIYISYDAGGTWTSYWSGTFWKTDCEFDGDAETVIVTPTVNDQYSAVLAGMEKEYNLIELLPEIVPIKADKRPMIQIYVPGQTVIGCFLSGMYWEQECDAESDVNKLKQTGDGKLNFALCKSLRMVEVSGNMNPILPEMFAGTPPASESVGTTYNYTNGDYKFFYSYTGSSSGSMATWLIRRVSDNAVMWEYDLANQVPPTVPYSVTLGPIVGNGASGNVTLYIHDMSVFGRIITDAPEILGYPTFTLPTDDITPDNRNYNRVLGYASSNSVYFSTRLSNTPTQWGIYEPGIYYDQPALYWNPELFPVARNSWGKVSIWFTYTLEDFMLEESGRAAFTIRDAYPLASVISVLLGQIAPGVTHEESTDYSEFLYGTNPLTEITQKLLITPKSNVISSGYDQPAQKAPITLRNVTDMLRDCFRCYWFIDSTGRFRIEHIKYFMNGGTYTGTPTVGIDLTAEKVTRNSKEWAFARNQYQFDKPEMAARYQFGWADDVTQLFEGYPIDIVSKYVNPDNIEDITVSRFTSDIDYILLNPNAISKDGFVLLAAVDSNYLESSISESGVPASFVDFGIDLSGFIGLEVTIEVSCDVAGVKVGQSDMNFNYEEIGELTNANTNYSFTFVVSKPRIIIYDSNYNFTGTLSGIWGLCYKLPYEDFIIDLNDHYLQNAYVAFHYLQQYYAYDMPARYYKINGVSMTALGIKKLKRQSLKFPVLNDPDLVELVKTNIGNGMIQNLSVNLSSRNANATLKYDTE